MNSIQIIERPMTDGEYARQIKGFEELAAVYGNPTETEERFGFVALEDSKFIGCSSALAYKHAEGYANWCFLSDLFVEEPYRKHGLGRDLLARLEQRLGHIGAKYIYTWTASYEAPGFYVKQGYDVFTELDDWYRSGHPRVGLRKVL